MPLLAAQNFSHLNSCSHLLSFCVYASLASASVSWSGVPAGCRSARAWREPHHSPSVSVSSWQAFNSETDSFKLAYGGHQYHASCANFWINCVEPKPPGLILPDLLWELLTASLWRTQLGWFLPPHPLGWPGPINGMWVLWSPPTHQEESLKRWGEGCVASQSFPQMTFAPRFPGPLFGISGQTALPKMHVALEVC